MNKALQSNQASWQSKYTQLETNYRKFQIKKEVEITELKDEIRDLMFYMEAQNTISNSDLKDEIATSSISVPNPPPSQDVNQKQRRKKKWFVVGGIEFWVWMLLVVRLFIMTVL